MRALLLGGTGFLGSAIGRALRAQGHEVAVLHRGRTPCPKDAICIHADRARLADHTSDIAALSPGVVIDTCADASPSLRRTLFSSAGPSRLLVVNRAARDRADWLGSPATVVRLAALYGPGDPARSLYPLWRRMRDGRSAILLPRADAESRTPRIYIENAACGIALAATHPRARGRAYELCEPHAFNEAEWAQQVALAMGWRGRIVITPAALARRCPSAAAAAADSSRIRAELGYREVVSPAHALAATLAWEQAHPPLPSDAARLDYAGEDALLRSLGLVSAVGFTGNRTAKIANSAATTASAQTLASGPAVPPVIQREP